MTPSYIAFSYDNPISYYDKTVSLLKDEYGKFTYKVKCINFNNPDISCNECQTTEEVSEEVAREMYNTLMHHKDYSVINMAGNPLFT